MIISLLFTINCFIIVYLLGGFLLWIIPHDCGGYVSCGFEDYNILFIFFWLPSCFNDKIQEAISK